MSEVSAKTKIFLCISYFFQRYSELRYTFYLPLFLSVSSQVKNKTKQNPLLRYPILTLFPKTFSVTITVTMILTIIAYQMS